MQIIIPVSPMSRAIISSMYREPVRLSEYDFMYNLLIAQRIACNKYIPNKTDEELLTQQVAVELPPILEAQNIDLMLLGYLIHQYHYNKLMTIIEARIELVGKDILPSIRYAMQKYNITEEDMPQETIAKRFYRYRKKNAQILDSSKSFGVLKKGQKSKIQKKPSKGVKKLTAKQLEEEINRMVELYPLLIRNNRGNLIPAKVKALKAYVYHCHAKLRVSKILELLNIKRSTYFAMINRLKKQIDLSNS